MTTLPSTDSGRSRGEPVVMRQQWSDLLFLHWPLAPEVVQPLLPPGLTVDTFRGRAYAGLVPFRMTGVSPAWLAPVPLLSDLLECNVRTYVRRADGSAPGVWFFSLDASSPPAVAVARGAFALPYYMAWMEQRERREPVGASGWARDVEYRVRRVHPGAPGGGCDIGYRLAGGAAGPAAPGTLDHFLVERYVLYSSRGGRLFAGEVHHDPYRIEAAELRRLSDTLVHAAGLPQPAGPPATVHYSRRVIVSVTPLRAL